MTEKNKVLLTGASGFLAVHILTILLDRGYTVVGTVRNKHRGDYLLDKFQGKPLSIVYVEDIMSPNAFDKVLQEDKSITAVIHSASPLTGKTHEEVIGSAIEGTKNILNAVKVHAPQVKHFVLTSSFAAVTDTSRRQDPTYHVTEESWNPITHEDALTHPRKAYFGSKTFAETAFWKFIKEEKPEYVATVVCPPFIFGPIEQQVDSVEQLNVAGSNLHILNPLFVKKEDGFDFTAPTRTFIDVRDVALAHVLPLEKPELGGKRLVPISDYFTAQMALDVANDRFPQLRGIVPVGEPGTGYKRTTQVMTYDVSKTTELLGFKYRPLNESIYDTLTSYLALKKKLEANA